MVPEGRPDLLAVDHPSVTVEPCARAHAGEIRSRVGLAEALAPDHVGGDDLRDEAPLLALGSAGDERGTDHLGALDAQPVRRARPRALVREHDLRADTRRAAAVSLGEG